MGSDDDLEKRLIRAEAVLDGHEKRLGTAEGDVRDLRRHQIQIGRDIADMERRVGAEIASQVAALGDRIDGHLERQDGAQDTLQQTVINLIQRSR